MANTKCRKTFASPGIYSERFFSFAHVFSFCIHRFVRSLIFSQVIRFDLRMLSELREIPRRIQTESDTFRSKTIGSDNLFYRFLFSRISIWKTFKTELIISDRNLLTVHKRSHRISSSVFTSCYHNFLAFCHNSVFSITKATI